MWPGNSPHGRALMLVVYLIIQIIGTETTQKSDLDRIRQMFPGDYDNFAQYLSDIAMNKTEHERHNHIIAKIIGAPAYNRNGSAQFYFRAYASGMAEHPVARVFEVSEDSTGRLLLTVHHLPSQDEPSGHLEYEPSGHPEYDLNNFNNCKFIWYRTFFNSYINFDPSPCIVDGWYAKYRVNTTLELSDKYFSILEKWELYPEWKWIYGPHTPYKLNRKVAG